MAKDPAFMFYPGDYLRDTQNLSEKSQVAYDRIMCEHMRNISNHMKNICVSQKQLDFFIKRLTNDEKEELMFVLVKRGSNYQIEWVALSIAKRKAYVDSRSKNKAGKTKNHMKSYDLHMEDEDDNEDKDKDTNENTNAIDKDIVNDLFRGLNAILHRVRPCVKSNQYLTKIKSRLQKYSPQEILEAANNLIKDPFMNGDNNGQHKYATMEYLTRNDEHVHKWLESGQGKMSRLKENLDVTT